MRRVLLIIVSFLFIYYSQKTSAQSRDTQNLIKEVKRIIKKKSFFSEKIDWSKLDEEIKSIDYTGQHNKDKEKVFNIIINALKQAGDQHSLFLNQEISLEIKKNQNENIYSTSKYLGQNIGYLKIPHCFTFNAQKDAIFSNNIINQIKNLDEYEVEKWIIDLRDNKGGNVWPMLSGLTPIIDDGLINYSIGNKTETENFIEKGKIAKSETSILTYTTKQKFKKLAVIINNNTASSGEMLAISLLGFNDTKSFGYNSRGLTTVNSTFSFKDGTMLFLATGYMADKNKKIYHNGIIPDVIFETGLNEKDILAKVIKWLNE